MESGTTNEHLEIGEIFLEEKLLSASGDQSLPHFGGSSITKCIAPQCVAKIGHEHRVLQDINNHSSLRLHKVEKCSWWTEFLEIGRKKDVEKGKFY